MSAVLSPLESIAAGSDGDFWSEVRGLYPIVDWEYIHFNSGSAGVMPRPVLDYQREMILRMNSMAPYQAWVQWQPIKKKTLGRLEQLIGASDGSTQIMRNTTEALNTIITTMPLDSGDEIIVARHDYPFALNAYRHRADRDGATVVQLDLDLPLSDDEIVHHYEQAITDGTRYIHLTAMTHREGHILPVKRLTDMAHEHGVQVVVDGAHTIAHYPIDLTDWGVDYFATSLHKWLQAPHGNGLIYVRPDRLAGLRPFSSCMSGVEGTMDQYEHMGTRAFNQEIGIDAALDYHDWLGFDRKMDRLHELRAYWTDRLSNVSGIVWHTDLAGQKYGAIASFSINGKSSGAIKGALKKEHSIHVKTVGIKPKTSAVRISVDTFTSFEELDRLVEAIHLIAKN